LPTGSTGAERINDVSVKPQINGSFGPLQFRPPDWPTADFQDGGIQLSVGQFRRIVIFGLARYMRIKGL